MIHSCPECGVKLHDFKKIETYRYKLDDTDISTLLKLWQYVIERGTNRINTAEVDLNKTEDRRVTQLRYHALIAKIKNQKGKHIARHWCLTKRGADFLKGKIVVPKYVTTKNNVVIGHSKELVHRSEYKILKDFQAGFEIINERVVQIKNKQMILV